MTQPCIFLMGPTASGKTDLAVTLVKQFPCEIISVDSAMVYRGLDIGTAKPSADILAQAPHRLLNIRDPAEIYSAAQFREDAIEEIQAIRALGRIPLLVGGTGLYFRALQYGLSDLPSANAEVRSCLTQEAEHIGWQGLHERLAQLDPVAAHRIHPSDAQRIQRALEVYALTGYTVTEWYAHPTAQPWSESIVKIVLAPAQRDTLHARIAHRFQEMLMQGLVEEVRELLKRSDLHPKLPALRAVGYRQVVRYLTGEIDYATMTELAIIATRQLAKRQLTWLRSEKEGQWFTSLSANGTQQVLEYLTGFIHQNKD
ncbi:MAG: tRNA (adenosine(37)-N6)-dimethylallyltransferase MiaA [Beggiatoa sp. IS2]|nr:MAG: tRNA (adenosine(37)-N6)-dimethylallyltransferase MiaA [Beggiatoa sp. IS2]